MGKLAPYRAPRLGTRSLTGPPGHRKSGRLLPEVVEEEEAQAQQEGMPKQNGVRRPKPHTLGGQAWAIFNEVTAKTSNPATIAESMEIGRAQGLNEGNVRAEFYSWRKFNGISGRST